VTRAESGEDYIYNMSNCPGLQRKNSPFYFLKKIFKKKNSLLFSQGEFFGTFQIKDISLAVKSYRK